MEAVRELLASLARLAELSDDELATLASDLRAAAEDDELTVEVLVEIADGLDAIASATTERTAAADAESAERDAALARIRGEAGDDGDDEGDEGGEGDASPDAPAGDDADAEPAEADAEPEPAMAGASAAAEGGTGGAAAPAAKPVARPRPSAASMTAARPAAHRPAARPARAHNRILVAGNVPMRSAGDEVTLSEVGHLLAEKARLSRGAADGFYPVASILAEYPDERRLNGLEDTGAQRRVAAALDLVNPFSPHYGEGEEGRALVASGGLCAPVQPYYGIAMVSDDGRPIRASLAQFQAERGGITFRTPPILTDILVNEAGSTVAGKAITVHTNQNDIDALTKTVQTVACPGTVTVTVDSIVKRLKFGNIAGRTDPERTDAFVGLTSAQHARVAERKLITRMGQLSTAVNSATVLGAARDVLGTLDRAYAAFVNRHRMADGVKLHAWFPRWVVQLCRVDMTNQLASEMASFETDEAWFRAQCSKRGFNVTLFWDGETGQDFGAQGIGGLFDFPNTMKWVMSHEGAFLFLDAGELNLGVVRDSTLNAANDYEFFAETWEAVAFLGVESLKVTSNVCASGLSATTKDTSGICSAASYGS